MALMRTNIQECKVFLSFEGLFNNYLILESYCILENAGYETQKLANIFSKQI